MAAFTAAAGVDVGVDVAEGMMVRVAVHVNDGVTVLVKVGVAVGKLV